MSGPGSGPPEPLISRRRVKRAAAWMVAVLLLLTAVLHYTGWARLGWSHLMHRRAERFTDDGFKAWQTGRYREAEFLFASAVQADPGARRARQLLGQMLLQTRRLPEAREVFVRLLATEKGADRQDTATLYFETLVSTASFEELARFCLAEISGLPPVLRAQWGAAAVEATRLARVSPSAVIAVGPAPAANPPALEVLLAAQQCLNAGRRKTAEAWLLRLDGHQLDGSLQASALRLVLEVQGPDRARRLLNQVGRVLDNSEMAFNDLWLAAATGGEDLTLAARSLPAAFPRALAPRLVLQRLGRLLLCPDPELPRLLAARFQADAASLSKEQLATLWLAWELNRAGRRDNPWSRLLSERVRFTVLARDPGEMTVAQMTGIVNSIPLARDTVVSLLMRLPVPAAQSVSAAQ